MIITEGVVIASFYSNTSVLRKHTSCGNVTISVKILAQNSKHSNPYYILKPTYKKCKFQIHLLHRNNFEIVVALLTNCQAFSPLVVVFVDGMKPISHLCQTSSLCH